MFSVSNRGARSTGSSCHQGCMVGLPNGWDTDTQVSPPPAPLRMTLSGQLDCPHSCVKPIIFPAQRVGAN